MDATELKGCRDTIKQGYNDAMYDEANAMARALTPFELACLAIIARNESMLAWDELDRLRLPRG